MNILSLSDVDIHNKRVLIRQDLNVPIEDGRISNDARLRAALPTLRFALDSGAKIQIMSHLGRPKEGEFNAQFSLAVVARYLESALQVPVTLQKNWRNSPVTPEKNAIVLYENVRFEKGEKANEDTLAKYIASLCDIFVMDAFGTAHRAQASTYGVAQYAPIACAGPLLTNELAALARAFEQPKRPIVAIVGGAKVSSKLTVLSRLAEKVDQLIVGGGIANTFLAAAGYNIGTSLSEPDLLEQAKALMQSADIPLPEDVVCADKFDAQASSVTCNIDKVASQSMILDIGPKTAQRYANLIQNAGTIIWNGPLGVFEFSAFSEGTKKLSQAIAQSKGFSVAGGGDTVAAIEKFQVEDQISYISTGGGAFLEYLEGKTLPAVEILMQRARDTQ